MQVRVNCTSGFATVSSGIILFLIYYSEMSRWDISLIREGKHIGTTRSRDIAACMCLQQYQCPLQSLTERTRFGRSDECFPKLTYW